MMFMGAPEYIVYMLIIFLGLAVGSFLNVVIYRLPREDLSISHPKRSFCPSCEKAIRWYDNLPVVSWLLLRARCRDCGQHISFRYPLVELASGLLALYLYHRFGLTLTFLAYFYFVMCLLAIALIDLELMVIPVSLMYPATIIGLIVATVEPSPALTGTQLWLWWEPTLGSHLTSLAGATLGLTLGWGAFKLVSSGYKLVRGHEGMGDGDPPLLGMIGAFLGWKAIPFVILASSLIGLLSVALLMIFSRSSAPEQGWGLKAVPFGPFLVLAALVYIFFGPQLIYWYFSFL